MSGIRPGDRVTMHYRLGCAGQEVVSTLDGEPETFTVGAGDIDPRLEWLLHGLTPGIHETWRLDPEQAFGRHDTSLVKTLPVGFWGLHRMNSLVRSVMALARRSKSNTYPPGDSPWATVRSVRCDRTGALRNGG